MKELLKRLFGKPVQYDIFTYHTKENQYSQYARVKCLDEAISAMQEANAQIPHEERPYIEHYLETPAGTWFRLTGMSKSNAPPHLTHNRQA